MEDFHEIPDQQELIDFPGCSGLRPQPFNSGVSEGRRAEVFDAEQYVLRRCNLRV